MKGVKFGVITDAHIPNIETIEKNLYNALFELKRREVDLIIFAGDICDQNQEWAYELYKTIFDSVFFESRPQILAVSGNHDLWKNVHVCDRTAVENLKKYNFQSDINTHMELNGFHFIGVTSYPYFNGKDTELKGAVESSKRGDYTYIEEWLKAELEKACSSSEKPVFVVTHFPPKNTLPGSYLTELDGNQMLADIFKRYPQVISISGHTHFSLYDDRSIHQRDFTSVNAGSLHCVCCTQIEKPNAEGGLAEFINLVRQPADAYRKFPTYLYGEADEKEVRFTRLCASTNERCGEDWRITYPVKKENFVYTDDRLGKAAPLRFAEDDFLKVFPMKNKDYFKGNSLCYALVKIPKYEGRVVGFKYILEGNGKCKEEYVYSEIDDNIAYPKVFHIIALQNLEQGAYRMKVYALESFGGLSENYLETQFMV